MAVEKQLAEIGYLIDKDRRKFIEIIIEMQMCMEKKGHFPILKLKLDTCPIKNGEDFFEELQKSRKTDFNAKRTLIGPHKTDLCVNHGLKNIQAKNCSTGEQKSLLLSLVY